MPACPAGRELAITVILLCVRWSQMARFIFYTYTNYWLVKFDDAFTFCYAILIKSIDSEKILLKSI